MSAKKTSKLFHYWFTVGGYANANIIDAPSMEAAMLYADSVNPGTAQNVNEFDESWGIKPGQPIVKVDEEGNKIEMKYAKKVAMEKNASVPAFPAFVKLRRYTGTEYAVSNGDIFYRIYCVDGEGWWWEAIKCYPVENVPYSLDSFIEGDMFDYYDDGLIDANGPFGSAEEAYSAMRTDMDYEPTFAKRSKKAMRKVSYDNSLFEIYRKLLEWGYLAPEYAVGAELMLEKNDADAAARALLWAIRETRSTFIEKLELALSYFNYYEPYID